MMTSCATSEHCDHPKHTQQTNKQKKSDKETAIKYIYELNVFHYGTSRNDTFAQKYNDNGEVSFWTHHMTNMQNTNFI